MEEHRSNRLVQVGEDAPQGVSKEGGVALEAEDCCDVARLDDVTSGAEARCGELHGVEGHHARACQVRDNIRRLGGVDVVKELEGDVDDVHYIGAAYVLPRAATQDVKSALVDLRHLWDMQDAEVELVVHSRQVGRGGALVDGCHLVEQVILSEGAGAEHRNILICHLHRFVAEQGDILIDARAVFLVQDNGPHGGDVRSTSVRSKESEDACHTCCTLNSEFDAVTQSTASAGPVPLQRVEEVLG